MKKTNGYAKDDYRLIRKCCRFPSFRSEAGRKVRSDRQWLCPGNFVLYDYSGRVYNIFGNCFIFMRILWSNMTFADFCLQIHVKSYC